MLGSALRKPLEKLGDLLNPRSSDLDLRDRTSTLKFLDAFSPKVVVHTAAMTNVEACEDDPKKAFLTNSEATQNLVDGLMGSDAHLIFISSTGVYGNHLSKPYTEVDQTIPTTVHHRSKKLGEDIVARHLPFHTILRTGWLYGGETTQPKNFVYKRFLEARGSDQLISDPSQIGCPTWVDNLVSQIIFIINEGVLGTYNAVDHGAASRSEYVKQIIKSFNLPCEVVEGTSTNFQRKAKVSPNESAENFRLQLRGLDQMSPWEESLDRYIHQLKTED
jgi:dTDP-4-dehydrorhamnose reductase